MNIFRVIVLCTALTVVAGCALGTMSKVKELHQGMTTEQVKAVMGEPSSVQLVNGLPVWRYSLHEYFVGWVPHYLVFNQEDQLIGWTANMSEYYANQIMMMSAFQSMQHSSQPAAAAGRGGVGTADNLYPRRPQIDSRTPLGGSISSDGDCSVYRPSSGGRSFSVGC